MIRLIIVLLLVIFLYFLIRSAVREFRAKQAGGVPSRDQMVQDPVCRVYVPRGSAVEANIGGQSYYFCSRNCANTFESRLSG